ncbi:HAD family hydrolase [Listeria grandensis]|uniref:HAD family hydrolase n=2 Tax=Listeria grandensis TaxID=1494963 RepID=A0A7X0Y2E7_9LIST|nr:HAD family hydrolase [Listeria grandensis]
MKYLEGLEMNNAYIQVRDFHEKFNAPIATTPTMLDKERLETRISWVEEELQELRDAKTVVDQADAVIDGLYFLIGTLVEMGVEPERLFQIVQDANMAKLWPDGKAHFRESDNKIMKPAGWIAPEPQLEKEIERQTKASKHI